MLRVETDEDLLSTLEEHLLSLSTIKNDQFHVPFKDIVTYWESTLSVIAELLELLQQVQRQWAYLENVFRGRGTKMEPLKVPFDSLLWTRKAFLPLCLRDDRF